MANDEKKKPADPPMFNEGRRNFFRLLFNPVSSAAKGYELPANHTSQNPPKQNRVIRPGPGNRGVTALLGPLATGTPAPGGYRLYSVQVGEADIRYVFERAGKTVHVLLNEPGARVGHVVGATASFAMLLEGDAPLEERMAVARQVLAEVHARDQGQLWTVAAATVLPKSPG